jgi:hypothetical protein
LRGRGGFGLTCGVECGRKGGVTVEFKKAGEA